jgi:hypothetical protein
VGIICWDGCVFGKFVIGMEGIWMFVVIRMCLGRQSEWVLLGLYECRAGEVLVGYI